MEVAEEFAGVGGQDADVAVGDEHGDRRAGVFAADADLVELGVVAEGDFAVVVDAIASVTTGKAVTERA